MAANPLPDLWLLALLGLTTQRFSNNVVDDGDALITGWGQRFLPNLGVVRNGSRLNERWQALRNGTPISNAEITERLLGFEDANMATIRPRRNHPEAGNPGFKHTTFQETDAVPEVHVDCAARAGCTHDGFLETLAWLGAHPSAPAPTRPEIPLELRVLDATGSALAGADVRLMDGSSLVGKGITGAGGRLTLPLPFVPQRSFSLYVNRQGFRSGVRSVRTFELPSETPTQLGDIILTSNQPAFGNLAGQVVDALNGAPLAGVLYTLTRIDQLTPLRSGTTAGDGTYELRDLLAARYVLRLEREGYETAERAVDVLANTTNSLQIGLSPILQTVGSARIVLTWAEDPRDLDSHLWKFRPDGSTEYHIFYAARQGTGGDFLDRDDTSSFGPETTTIQQVDPAARYLFAVFDFAGSGSIATTSQAQVTVQLGDGSSRVFNTPPGGVERWWTVFEILGGAIRPCNSNCLGNIEPAALSPAISARALTKLPSDPEL